MQQQAFRTGASRQLNAAVFDSMTVGLAHRIKTSAAPTTDTVAVVHRSLLDDQDYLESVSGGTAQERTMKTRISKAVTAFQNA